VYTQASGAPLNVIVKGTSDHLAQTGVYNIDYIQVYDDIHDIAFNPTMGNYIQFDTTTKTPDFHIEGRVIPRAAVVVMSAKTLNIGSGAELIARGNYYSQVEIGRVIFDVDDRPAIDFLDVPATIGGHLRDEGEPFDLAIYMASNTGDVQIGGEVRIQPCSRLVTALVAADNFDSTVPAPATVVADAFYNVKFLDNFLSYLEDTAGRREPFRMEVCSRVTEWLSQAIANNRLPYAADTGFMEDLLGLECWPGDDYVLRGAGLGNPGITDGRKWVLEDPPPLPTLAAPLPRWEIPVIEGCPLLLEAASAEVGIARETIQVSIERALATRPNIQPCDACARLVDYAAILRDVDGTRMAAMLQVFNEIAPADAPFTPEMASSIATAFAEHLDDSEMPQYATTMEYIDAFVGYIAVMDDELGSPVDDSVAFAIEKYGTPLEESGNANITAYIQMRLAALGG
ncbi:MAG: hypothetical protein KAX31_01430, partial [Thermoplasmata archaeon]|nr:hypothetical protein [Thermoplasmata archaeon]